MVRGAREALGVQGLCPSPVGLTVSLQAVPGAWAPVLCQGRSSWSFPANEVQCGLQQSCSWLWAPAGQAGLWALRAADQQSERQPLTDPCCGRPSGVWPPDASILASCLASLRDQASPHAWSVGPPASVQRCFCGPGALGVMPAPLQSVLPGLGPWVHVPSRVALPLCCARPAPGLKVKSEWGASVPWRTRSLGLPAPGGPDPSQLCWGPGFWVRKGCCWV